MVQLKLSATHERLRALWHSGDVSKDPEPVNDSQIPGLANLGNTCFMNSVLQCLLNTPGWLAEACRTFKEPDFEDEKLTGRAILGRCFAELVSEYNTTQGTSLARTNQQLKSMKAAIASIDKQYAGCEQQDAYEFLGCLLEGLEENFKALYHRGENEKQITAGVIRAVCGVGSHTKRTCHACSKCFEVDHVTDTAVRLPLISMEAQMDEAVRTKETESPVSLVELLEMMRKPEDIEGYDCDSCGEIAKAKEIEHARSKVTQHAGIISRTSDVLTVVLNRCCQAFDAAGNFKPTKVKRQVNFESSLKLETGEYQLFGVVSHLGSSLTSGHYIAAVKSLRDEMWYECDDERVKPLNLKALYDGRPISSLRTGAEPYILFYQRVKSPDLTPVPALQDPVVAAEAAEESKTNDAEPVCSECDSVSGSNQNTELAANLKDSADSPEIDTAAKKGPAIQEVKMSAPSPPLSVAGDEPVELPDVDMSDWEMVAPIAADGDSPCSSTSEMEVESQETGGLAQPAQKRIPDEESVDSMLSNPPNYAQVILRHGARSKAVASPKKKTKLQKGQVTFAGVCTGIASFVAQSLMQGIDNPSVDVDTNSRIMRL
eukprot:TRINITY_DN39288_c0_g1_i2.p1 TRINITY_DN39288_c0_g1~~TRINITY_DN39288_c0_g1_i2.p1  ORF type:complete len:601 (-),score=126.51 TRINITY_DN39288_c0_g1_i2:267-2069(-)